MILKFQILGIGTPKASTDCRKPFKPPLLPQKGQEYELNIESLAYGGKGISRVNDFVIFVKNVIPGQKVRALVYRKRKGYAEARPLEIITESEHLVDAPCTHFLTCGGCKVQQLSYDEQIEQKKQQIENILVLRRDW